MEQGGNATAWARPGGRPATKVENLPARSGGTATGVPAPVTRVRALAPAVSGACRVPMAATPDAPRADAAGRIETVGVARQPTLIVPRITDQWPGKLQKNSYGPSPLIALAGKVTEVVPPPPTSSVWAITRGSSAGT